MVAEGTPSSAASSGRARPVREWLAPWLALLQVRLRLLAVEAEDEALRLGTLFAWGAVAALGLGLGIAFAAVLVAVLFWESHRVTVLLVLCTLFLTLGGVAVWMVRGMVQEGSRLFTASLAELQRDRDRLDA